MTRILTLTAAATLAFTGCSQAPAPERPAQSRSIQVVAEPLRVERTRAGIEAVGTSRAVLSAEMYPATSGEVVSVNFEPGQAVEAGDVLVELDAREQKLAVRLAELKLEDAEHVARLDGLAGLEVDANHLAGGRRIHLGRQHGA